MTPLSLVLALALSTGAVADEPWSDAASTLAEDPTNAMHKLELAQQLSLTDGKTEEAVASLMGLLSEPTVGEGARAALANVVLGGDPRPGWDPVYQALLSGERDPGMRYAIRLHRARANVLSKSRRSAAITSLRALAQEFGGDQAATLALGHGYLLDGDSRSAENTFRGAVGSREGREALLLASFASGSFDSRGFWTDRLRDAGFSESQIRASVGEGSLQTDSELVILRTLFLEQGGATTHAEMNGRRTVIGSANLDSQIRSAVASPTRPLRALALASAGYGELGTAIIRGTTRGETRNGAELPVLNELGQTLLRLEEPKGAAAAFDQALTISPGEPEAREGLAQAFLASGKWDAAIDVLAGVRGDIARQVYAEAAAFKALATPSKADDRPALAEAWQRAPDNAKVAKAWGLHLLRAGRTAEAMGPLTVALRNDPTDGTVVNAAVKAAIDSGRPQDGLELASASIGSVRDSADYGELVGSLAKAWIARAEQLKREKELTSATDAYMVAHLLLPQESGVLSGLGGTMWESGNHEGAYVAYKRAYDINPGDTGVLSSLIQLSVATGREEEARTLRDIGGSRIRGAQRGLDMALELSEADIAVRNGQYDKALLQYQRLQARDPNNGNVLRAIANLRMTQGEHSKALDYFQRAVRVDGNDQWSRLGAANAFIALGNLQAAADSLNDIDASGQPTLAREVRRSSGSMLLRRGGDEASAGHPREAYNLYIESMNLEQSTWAFSALGGLYFQCGDHVMARASYEEALLLDPGNSAATIGKIRVLLSRGNVKLAEGLANELLDAGVSDPAIATELEIAKGLAKADIERRTGNAPGSEAIVVALYNAHPDSDLAKTAYLSAMLDYGTREEVLAHAKQILSKEPLNDKALVDGMHAAFALAQTETMLPLIEKAADLGERYHRDLYDDARLMVALDRAKATAATGDTLGAMELVKAVESMAEDTADDHSLIGGTWLDLDETDAAMAAFDRALELDPRHAAALIGRSGALAKANKSNQGILGLKEAFETTGNPELGLALARMYVSRGDQVKAGQIVRDLQASPTAGGATCDLPAMGFPSGRVPEPFDDAPAIYSLSPRLEMERKSIAVESPGRFMPGVPVGAGFYARPGFSGEQFLNAFFFPVQVHDLRAGPLAFDLEAVPTSVSDGINSDLGVNLSAGVSAGLGIFSFHGRGGVSPIGFDGGTYGTWFGNADFKTGPVVNIGILTAREPVTDSLTSWSGQLDEESGTMFGRVSRSWFGGYLSARPTEQDKFSAFGRGGWNDGLQMEQVNFWEVVLDGGHTFDVSSNVGVHVGGIVLGMGFDQQLDKFTVGQGGFFAPALFAMGAARLEGNATTKDDRLSACLGGSVGPQYIQAEAIDADPDNYIQPGVFAGYSVAASFDYKIAKFWRLGVDYSRQVTANTWQQNIAMVHLHFGPGNTWAQKDQPAFSALAGSPIGTAQVCGKN